LLRGNGQGAFEAVPGQSSGLTVYGEGRGAGVCDFDEDGRADLAVGQNGAETRLFHNIGAKPGLRIRVIGPLGNPDGIGTQLRAVFGERMGPVHELRAGGGYWSQDSSVQVIGGPSQVTGLWVRWPGGATNRFAVPAGAREISVGDKGVVAPKQTGP
jgi:hypothetical protein